MFFTLVSLWKNKNKNTNLALMETLGSAYVLIKAWFHHSLSVNWCWYGDRTMNGISHCTPPWELFVTLLSVSYYLFSFLSSWLWFLNNDGLSCIQVDVKGHLHDMQIVFWQISLKKKTSVLSIHSRNGDYYPWIRIQENRRYTHEPFHFPLLNLM